MASKIKIFGPKNILVDAELSQENPKTAKAVLGALPLEARANTWGEEIYFSIPVELGLENPKEVVEIGDLGYWPPGSAFCIFFGRTPISKSGEIRPASPVNVFGSILGDPTIFRTVKNGDKVRIERV